MSRTRWWPKPVSPRCVQAWLSCSLALCPEKGDHHGGECEIMPEYFQAAGSREQKTQLGIASTTRGMYWIAWSKSQVLLVLGRTWFNKSLLALFLVGFYLHRPRMAVGIPGRPASLFSREEQVSFPHVHPKILDFCLDPFNCLHPGSFMMLTS